MLFESGPIVGSRDSARHQSPAPTNIPVKSRIRKHRLDMSEFPPRVTIAQAEYYHDWARQSSTIVDLSAGFLQGNRWETGSDSRGLLRKPTPHFLIVATEILASSSERSRLRSVGSRIGCEFIRRGGRVRSEADGPESLSVHSVSGPSRWSDPATQADRL